VTAGSNNQTLVPDANIILGGNGANRSVTITPAANQNGAATITVQVGDGTITASDTFVLTVNAVNDAPVATNDSYSLSEDTPLTVPAATGVLANDSDVENDPLSAQMVNGPSSGSLTLNADGSFTYTPNGNFCGADSFPYRASDGALNSATATVTITVACVNDAPTIADIADTSTNEDTPSGAIGFTIGDAETAPVSLTVTASSNNQALIPDANIVLGGSGANRSVTITPAANQVGTATITAQVSDGTDSASDTFVLTVNAVNDAPTATDDSLTMAEDSAATVVDVLANDTSAPDTCETLTVTAVTQPANGSVTLTGGVVEFTPDADFTGSTSFTYDIADGNGGMDTATVSIMITPVNDPPTLDAIADVPVLESALAQTVGLSGISAGPADESVQTLTITAVSNNPALIPDPSVTYTSPNATGTLSFTPAARLSGSAAITVTVTDRGISAESGGQSFTRTFLVFVGAVNNRPSLDPPAPVTILEDAAAQTVTLSGIIAGPVDENSQTLTVTATSSAPALIPNPTVIYSSPDTTGSLSFTPATNANGTATITVRVADNGGIDFIERTFTVNVTSVNDAPDFIAGPNQIVTASAGPQSIAGWATSFTTGPSDEASQTVLAYQIVSNSAPALFATAPAIDPTGMLTYTPKPGTGGTATIGVVARDSGGTANGGVDISAVRTFTIAIQPLYFTYIPFATLAGTPDLVVSSVSLNPSKSGFSAGEPVEITVVVENRGDRATGPFWIDLSINPDQPPTIANQPWNGHCALTPCYGLAWYVQDLAPDARVTLTSKQLAAGYSIWPGWLAAGTTDLYAYADTYNPGEPAGAVAESDETNNQFHLGGLSVTGSNPPLIGLRSVVDLSRRPARFR
jgi:VCBS repeat-containing protein